jgi:hypothetical protein
MEGALQGHLIVIGFPGMAHARGWYGSPACRAILPLRTANARSTVVLVPGVTADPRATDVLSRRPRILRPENRVSLGEIRCKS